MRGSACPQWEMVPAGPQRITGVCPAGLPLENRLCIWVNLENILHLLCLLLARPVLVGWLKFLRPETEDSIYNPGLGEPPSLHLGSPAWLPGCSEAENR